MSLALILTEICQFKFFNYFTINVPDVQGHHTSCPSPWTVPGCPVQGHVPSQYQHWVWVWVCGCVGVLVCWCGCGCVGVLVWVWVWVCGCMVMYLIIV